jgi:hypothetical protein
MTVIGPIEIVSQRGHGLPKTLAPLRAEARTFENGTSCGK